MSGETRAQVIRGLSPRVRRHHDVTSWFRKRDRSISACAEAPGEIRVEENLELVYLRVCGGTRIINTT